MCWMFTAAMTLMPASSNSSHVLVALLVPAAGDIAVGELVDDAELRFARDDRVEVHLLEHDAAVVDAAPGNHLEIAELRLGVGAAVGLDEPDDHVDAFATEACASCSIA